MLPLLVYQLEDDILTWHGGAVGTICDHCIVHVYDREEPGRKRNLLPFQTARIACSIPLLVMAIGNLEYWLGKTDVLSIS